MLVSDILFFLVNRLDPTLAARINDEISTEGDRECFEQGPPRCCTRSLHVPDHWRGTHSCGEAHHVRAVTSNSVRAVPWAATLTVLPMAASSLECSAVSNRRDRLP